MKFHYFLGIDFRIVFFMRMAPKMDGRKYGRHALFRTFFATLSFMCRFSPRPPILGAIWLTLGSLWPPFGSLLAPAGSLLAPFWLPLDPFWLTFGVPWLTFRALSFTFAYPGLNFLTFAVSLRHFSYLLEFPMKNIMQNEERLTYFEKNLSRQIMLQKMVTDNSIC